MKKSEILANFAQNIGISAENAESFSMHGITRPHLITLVEELEEKTGKILQRIEDNQPLAWLNEKGVTLGDIADYFTGGSLKIAVLSKGVPFERMERFVEKVKVSFKEMLEEGVEFTDDSVLSKLEYSFGHYDDAVYLMEMDSTLKVVLPVNIPLDGTSTVKDLVMLFVEYKKF